MMSTFSRRKALGAGAVLGAAALGASICTPTPDERAAN
jgi:hypothetical protein